MSELWAPVNEFPNYEVSTLGRVKNITTDKILKNNIKSGYCNIALTNNATKKTCKVHRLVALAFIENPENKLDVNHKDKNKLNNHITNLEWMTRTENNVHRCQNVVITTNKNKCINKIDKTTNKIIDHYNSIEDAALWTFNNGLTKNIHNGRNAIGNCITGLSQSAYGFKWQLQKTDELLEGEVWKQIVIENITDSKTYYVSNLGRFKNSHNVIMDNYKVNDSGYIRVFIYNKTYALHRLVALTFLDNPENKEQVNHKDGNKINNALNNLEWVTNQENQIHKFQTGLGNNYTRKVAQYSLDNVFIRDFTSIVSAAKFINISKSGIGSVLSGKQKTSGGFIWKYIE